MSGRVPGWSYRLRTQEKPMFQPKSEVSEEQYPSSCIQGGGVPSYSVIFCSIHCFQLIIRDPPTLGREICFMRSMIRMFIPSGNTLTDKLQVCHPSGHKPQMQSPKYHVDTQRLALINNSASVNNNPILRRKLVCG